jgi:hypothetical protein
MKNDETLGEEIDLLRGLIQLVREQITEEIEIRQLLSVLDAVGKAATRLATLIKAQQALGENEQFADALAEAVREVVTDFNSRG